MPVTTLQQRIVTNLRRLLTERNMRPERLCQQAEIDPGNFSKFMAQKKSASLVTIEKITTALKVDSEELFTRGGHAN